MSKNENPQFGADDLQMIETPTFDPTPWVGKFATIEKVAVEYFKQNDGTEKPTLLLETGKLPGTEVTVKRFYGLKRTDDGKIAWPSGGYLQDFLQEKRVDHPTKLKGLKVQLSLSDPRGPEKKRYLTF